MSRRGLERLICSRLENESGLPQYTMIPCSTKQCLTSPASDCDRDPVEIGTITECTVVELVTIFSPGDELQRRLECNLRVMTVCLSMLRKTHVPAGIVFVVAPTEVCKMNM